MRGAGREVERGVKRGGDKRGPQGLGLGGSHGVGVTRIPPAIVFIVCLAIQIPHRMSVSLQTLIDVQ